LTLDPALKQQILAIVPNLRAFAMSLVNNPDRADDLVQDTLVRAIANIHRFKLGTNLDAWLFTILRNSFHSEYRKRRREVEDADGSYATRLCAPPSQGAHLDFKDVQKALLRIPLDQREALLLVGAHGMPYEQAAEICGVAIGTIKSRVNRARRQLAELLAVERGDEFGPDSATQAAIQKASHTSR
jgi:RNA polymerase sigma-70 factor, ECF subfamily